MKKLSLVLTIVLMVQFGHGQTASSCNCCTDIHSQFDFWVGEWTVTQNGKLAGSNSIIKVQNNCVLQENWTSATPGYTGTSYNFYNATTQQWEQIWIDSSGQSLHLAGSRNGNAMVLKSKPKPNAKNQMSYNQITWTKNDDGTVRQLWEVFTEGVDTVIAFDGLYTPKS